MAAGTGNSRHTCMHDTREVSVYPIGVFKKRDLTLTAAEPILLPIPNPCIPSHGHRKKKNKRRPNFCRGKEPMDFSVIHVF